MEREYIKYKFQEGGVKAFKWYYFENQQPIFFSDTLNRKITKEYHNFLKQNVSSSSIRISSTLALPRLRTVMNKENYNLVIQFNKDPKTQEETYTIIFYHLFTVSKPIGTRDLYKKIQDVQQKDKKGEDNSCIII
jgi:hypothetical protein